MTTDTNKDNKIDAKKLEYYVHIIRFILALAIGIRIITGMNGYPKITTEELGAATFVYMLITTQYDVYLSDKKRQ